MNTWILSLTVSTLSWGNAPLPTPAPAPAMTAEHAAKLFRIEVYNTFRLDRAEFDRRRAQGDKVWKAFDTAGRPPAQRDEVLNWFMAAREASQAGANQALPALPQLSKTPPQQATRKAPQGEFPVVTSGREVIRVNAVPDDVATTLDIQLPPSAEPTTPKTTLVKQTTTANRAPHPEVAGTVEPLMIELPKDKRVVPTNQPQALPAPKPQPTPKADATATPTPAQPIATEDPFAVKSLFEPAVTPVPPTETATDVDPFAP